MKHVVFTCGRFNPPTKGHLKVFEKVREIATNGGCDMRIFTTKTHDKKRNPLPLVDKMMYLEALMPGFTVHETTNAFSACRELALAGFETATLVVGEDQGLDIVRQLNLYVGHADPQHDIGLKRVDGYVIPRSSIDTSATNARALAVDGNFEEFRKHIPDADDVVIKELYLNIRRNLVKKE